MSETKKLTTVCVECSDRDTINTLAEQLDLSQRQIISRLIEAYREKQTNKNNGSEHDPPNDVLERLAEDIEKVLARDERIISFIRQQEKELLKPILNGVLSNDAEIKLLTKILSNLE